jgi:hypothetical protein
MNALEEVNKVPTHLANVLTMLRDWQARVQNELDAWKPGHAPKRDLAQQMDQIAKASTPMAREMRHWVGTIKKVMDTMSLEDQTKVTVKFITSLSAGDRLKFYNHLRETEAAREDGGIVLHIGGAR